MKYVEIYQCKCKKEVVYFFTEMILITQLIKWMTLTSS
jgi:hypothetical protein